MVTWRYVMAVEDTEDAEATWTIRSLYISDLGGISWSEEPAAPQGATWLELQDDLTKMGRAVKEVLDLRVDPPVLRPAHPGSLKRLS